MPSKKKFQDNFDQSSISALAGRRKASEFGEELLHVAIDKIRANPHQPRVLFSNQDIGELAKSLEEIGFLQPLPARLEDDGYYTLIAGHRRLAAARMAGIGHIPIIQKIVTDTQLETFALVENVQRRDLHPIDTATAYQKLVEKLGSQMKVATATGVPRTTIIRYLSVLELGTEILSVCASIPTLTLQNLHDLLQVPASHRLVMAKKLVEKPKEKISPAPSKPTSKSRPFALKVKTSSNISFRVVVHTRKNEVSPHELLEALREATAQLENELSGSKQ